jgi:hypothetical protein
MKSTCNLRYLGYYVHQNLITKKAGEDRRSAGGRAIHAIIPYCYVSREQAAAVQNETKSSLPLAPFFLFLAPRNPLF